MRPVAVFLAVVLLGLGPAAAVDYSDPHAVVEAAYAPYVAGPDFDWSSFDMQALQSKALNDLYAKDAAEAGDEVGRIDFDPLIEGQDYDISKLVIGKPSMANGVATVKVTFDNFETPETIDVILVPEAGGYRIDDVKSSNPDYPYSLKALLEAPMP